MKKRKRPLSFFDQKIFFFFFSKSLYFTAVICSICCMHVWDFKNKKTKSDFFLGVGSDRIGWDEIIWTMGFG